MVPPALDGNVSPGCDYQWAEDAYSLRLDVARQWNIFKETLITCHLSIHGMTFHFDF
jgi:hypothetical protein